MLNMTLKSWLGHKTSTQTNYSISNLSSTAISLQQVLPFARDTAVVCDLLLIIGLFSSFMVICALELWHDVFNLNTWTPYSFTILVLNLKNSSFYILMCLNLYHSLGIFSRRQNDVIFLIFPRKQDLTFHANCLLRRQFAWNVKSCFLGKIRKIFQSVVCWKFYPEC